MNTIILKCVFAASVFITPVASAGQVDSENSNSNSTTYHESKRLNSIFKSLTNLIEKNGKKNSHIENLIKTIKSRVDSKDLLFVEGSPNKEKLIIEAAEFNYQKGDSKRKKLIIVNPLTVDQFERQPSVVYSILIHELKHAYDYYTNQSSFLESQNNLIEKKYYEADAIYIEGIFVRDYLLNQGFSITKFEQYLLDSMKNDNMDSFCITFLYTDLSFLHKLDGVKIKSISYLEKLSEIRRIGNGLINDFENHKIEKSSDWQNFMIMIKLYTYFYHYKQIVYDIQSLHSDAPLRPSSFDPSNFPKIVIIKNKMGDIINSHLDIFYYSKTQLYPMFNKI